MVVGLILPNFAQYIDLKQYNIESITPSFSSGFTLILCVLVLALITGILSFLISLSIKSLFVSLIGFLVYYLAIPNLGKYDYKNVVMNIFSTAPLTYAQAALGGTVRINTVDGEVEYEVKPGTQTDTRIRLKGKGVPSLRNKNIRGDQYVTLVVQVPTSLSAEAKEALRAFDAVSGDSLHTGAGEGIKQEKHHKKRGFFKKED